ncbi:MAG: LPXTG cell wall anchor domain-containing protein, partial [Clostridia bacterium]|nr:LPXTG cell wall anchor domain-containing protein [Clostridia bacterium]
TTTTTTGTSSTATGKVATGDSTSVALLIGMLMLAGTGVVIARKRIAE